MIIIKPQQLLEEFGIKNRKNKLTTSRKTTIHWVVINTFEGNVTWKPAQALWFFVKWSFMAL